MIVLGDDQPTQRSAAEIAEVINQALEQPVALASNGRILLMSQAWGAQSRLRFEAPDTADATQAIFGISAPREYHGTDAAPAQVTGVLPLPEALDPSAGRFLRIARDGAPPRDVDCAAQASNPSPQQVVDAINAALGAGAARLDQGHLTLLSQNTGAGAQIELQHYGPADARALLFGPVEAVTSGTAAEPATIEGQADLLRPADLGEQRLLRLAIDGERPVEIDVAGFLPSRTFADEVIERINAVLPGVASLTEKSHLRLTSPTAGEGSRVELLPLRALELIEYPPAEKMLPSQSLRHGDQWNITNDGAAETEAELEFYAPNGVAGPAFINTTSGLRVRLTTVVQPGEHVRLWRTPAGVLQAERWTNGHPPIAIPPEQILAGPLGAQSVVPFAGQRQLQRSGDTLVRVLNAPYAPNVVLLRAPASRASVRVAVAPAAPPYEPPPAADGARARLAGKLGSDAQGYVLSDGSGTARARLRPGPAIEFERHRDRVVVVSGPLHGQPSDPPLMVVSSIAELFDVTLHAGDGAAAVEERYEKVTIGLGAAAPDGLTQRLAAGSKLVLAEEHEKAAVLQLARGRSRWVYLDCLAARFNYSRFNQAHFAGGCCREYGVFDLSTFATDEDCADCEAGQAIAVFAPTSHNQPAIELQMRWTSHRPGSFVVNLPADLPARFGGRFNTARFGKAGESPETYPGVVIEPDPAQADKDQVNKDPNWIVNQLKQSNLVEARRVGRVPIGFENQDAPFRRPAARALGGGTESEHARLYLTEPGAPDIIEIKARSAGAWGNAITITVLQAGPAYYNVSVAFQGARFECAQQIALNGELPPDGGFAELPALTEDLLRPAPVGVLLVKAAGIHANITRDHR
jgi:hypothetical protein